MQVLE